MPSGPRLLVTATAAPILTLWLNACISAPAQEGRPLQDAPVELSFQDGGENYALIAGDVYRVASNGKREFVDRLYDPKFFDKNYRTRDGQILQFDPDTGSVHPVTKSFQDDFESGSSIEALIAPSRWHSSNTDPDRAGQNDNYYDLGNRATVSRERAHGGNASVRFHAKPNTRTASKASLVRNIMYFEKGDHVYFSGWFFIEETPSLYDAGGFTLVDLESSFMKSVGLRIIVRKNDALAFELEFPKTQFTQDSGSEVPFPTRRWVHVESHALLSDEDGQVQIWQDGRKVLDKRGRTLPLANTIYDRFEVGISAIAKGSRYEKVVFVDDIAISNSPIR